MFTTTAAAAITLAATLTWGGAIQAAAPNAGPAPGLDCSDTKGHLTATPSSIDRDTSAFPATALVWSVEVSRRCPFPPIVMLDHRTVPLSGQMTVFVFRTTTFVLGLANQNRPLAQATVTVKGDPGFIGVSPGRSITPTDITTFNEQWMQPFAIQQALAFATSTLQNRDPDGVWATGERMAAMVRMFDLTHDRRYLDHLRDLVQVALKYRDDLPLDAPDVPRPVDEIRNKQGLAAWGGKSVDYGGLHHVEEIVSSLYAYPMAAFARIVAEDPSLQAVYGCDGRDKPCVDAVDLTDRVRETVGVFLPQIRREREGAFIGATLTHPLAYRTRPTQADCDNAYNEAMKSDPDNKPRWDQKKSDCNLLRELAGKALPHNINLTFSMVLVELTRVLGTPFYVQSPKHVGGAQNMRDHSYMLISWQQQYFVNHLNPGDLKDQYSACEGHVCWHYMDSQTEHHGTHSEDADHGSMDMSYVGLFFRDLVRLRAATQVLKEPLALTDAHSAAFASTFVDNIAAGRDFNHDVAARASDSVAADNSRCEGWLGLTRSNPKVWQQCHAVTLRIVDDRQPYLNIGNHSALLASKQFLPP